MESSRPYFSIVTVSFNSAGSIERTLRSVLVQDFTDYEYIVVDGASTDGTMDVVKRLEPEFEGRMKWSSEPDGGIYDAFNKGCRKAEGRFVWIVNSDDYIEPGALSEVKRFIDSCSDCADPIISCGLRMVDTNGKELGTTIYSADDLEWRMSVDSIAFAHPATFIPKSKYEKYGYYDTRYRIMADLDWSRKVWISGETIKYAPFIVTNMTTGGASTKLDLKKNIADRKYYFSKFYATGKERSLRLIKWLWRYLKGKLKDRLFLSNNA